MALADRTVMILVAALPGNQRPFVDAGNTVSETVPFGAALLHKARLSAYGRSLWVNPVSSRCLTAPRKRAASAPSTMRWS
jgi:hypothetical protein